jgi:hypothetical protein
MTSIRSHLALVVACLSLGCGGSSTAAAPPQTPAAVVAEAPAQAPASAPADSAGVPAEDAVTWTAVENPKARYIAALAFPTAHDDSVTPDHLAYARLHAARTLQSFSDVELAPAHFDRAALLAESQKRKLLGVFFECGVTLHHVDDAGTHFAVNVAVVDLRTEDIVASMTGKATAPGPTSEENEQAALEGALNIAMRSVPQLLASLDGTPELTGH